MKRVLMVAALAAVATATYVATATGAQQAGPTARQFKALEKKVTKLQTDEKKVKTLAIEEAELLNVCMVHSAPIDQFGDVQNDPATFGYSYTDPAVNSGTPYLTTGLDLTANDDPGALWITGGTSACGNTLNASLRKMDRLAGVRVHTSAPWAFRAGSH